MQRLTAAFFAIVALALIPSSLFAQDKLDFFVGDSYMIPPISVNEQVVYCPVEGQCSTPGTVYTNRERLNGWELGAAHHFTPTLAIAGDFSAEYGLATSNFPSNGRARQYTYLAGPQWSSTSRFAPFIHGFAGASRQSATASGNQFFVTFPDYKWGFAAAFGGGIDAKVTPNFTFRIAQADFLLTRFGGNFQSQPRVSIGFIFSF